MVPHIYQIALQPAEPLIYHEVPHNPGKNYIDFVDWHDKISTHHRPLSEVPISIPSDFNHCQSCYQPPV